MRRTLSALQQSRETQLGTVNQIQVYRPPCSECGGLRRRVGVVPDIECRYCRIDFYRCEFCGRRSETTVCSFSGGRPISGSSSATSFEGAVGGALRWERGLLHSTRL
jgi:hypothetical protein